MPTRASDRFTTVRTEGAILPADLLLRVAAGDASLEGLSPASYHLIEGEKLNEATNRSWNRLLGAWTSFQGALGRLPTGDPGTSVTRDRWLLPLWQELGYGRLTPARPVEIDGKSYPVSHHWQHAPIHLVGCRADLDRRAPGGSGASLSSPHGLVQELLNRSDEHLWAFVSNGLKLRILRDNIRLTRQAYVEFDLQAMFEGKVYADFALLWRLCHQSRVEAEKAEQCWLERWSQAAQKQGLRALDQLRNGVEEAIAALGRGFLACPSNQRLRDRLRGGQLDAQDYYRQLLRLVYRLLFLFVAEDRELLFDPRADEANRERYTRFYSTSRLRRLAERLRGTQHTDLYQALALVMDRIGAQGCPELGLSALGSLLFSRTTLPDLNDGQLANADLLAAVRALALTSDGHALRAVDYRNLGSEELGSIYESLLELHPVLNAEAGTFALGTASGHERKTTGSYYTPTSLITCLLDSALDPVLDEAVRQPDPAAALLGLKVCDPACGSGHFLIAAAHRIAKRLAFVKTGEEEPPPDAVRAALRDVVSHCLYGVDINPMAVELCKVSLWMEALEPGKPLSFLDHHIQPGNSLIGSTPALLARGIPGSAFEPIEGDDKAASRELRKRNKDERRGQETMFERFETSDLLTLGNFAPVLARLTAIPDDTIAGVRAQEQTYADHVRSAGYEYNRLWADAWCAAFVIRKLKVDDLQPRIAITEQTYRAIERNPHVAPSLKSAIRALAEQYQFLHWHLAFPDVFQPLAQVEGDDLLGWRGGFDVVLGNPPWERIKLQEQEWFAERRPDIANARNAAERRRMIERLRTEDPALLAAFLDDRRKAEGESHFVRDSGRFPLCGRGDVNTYTLFAETNRQIIRATGRVGCIVPSGIATDDTTKVFFQDLMQTGSLSSLYSFFEIRLMFPDTDSRNPFCLLTMTGSERPAVQGTTFVFDARTPEELYDPERRFTLSPEDLSLLNPNTRTCPLFRGERDAELNKAIYRRVPVLLREGDPQRNPWGVRFLRMLDMANDSGLFRTAEQLEADGWIREGNIFRRDDAEYLPLYEAKMLHQFDHRFSTYEGQTESQANQGKLPELDEANHANPLIVVQPRYWVPAREVADALKDKWDRRWLLGLRDICRNTDRRTVIASVVPYTGIGHTAPTVLPTAELAEIALLQANLTSFVFDYVARQKIGGTHLTYGLFEQLAVLPPESYGQPSEWSYERTYLDWILPRVLELTYTAWDLQPFARDCGHDGPPFRWDDARRFLLRCELDAAFFHLYGISQEDAAYILDTFPVVRRKDEQAHGEYRTKCMILEIHAAMAEAARTGQPYQTRLDPPPADPRVAHPTLGMDTALTPQERLRIRVTSLIILLLRKWDKPAARNVLETALVLMLNDDARAAILKMPSSRPSRIRPNPSPQFFKGLDFLLGDMRATHFIQVVETGLTQAIALGADAPPTDRASDIDRTRVEETLRAIDILGESELGSLALEGVTLETYEFVS